MLQNSDSLNCVREKGMRMFSIFHKLEDSVCVCWFLVCLVVLHFFKGVVNIAGGKNLTVCF